MRPHLHLLGILQLVWGAIGLLLGVSVLLLAVGAVAIGVSSADERMAAGVTAGAFVVFAVALVAGGGVNVWAGRALRRHEPRGRIAVLTLGVLNLFVLPFGTALGIYAFWVLLHNESRTVFVTREIREG
jgi:Na+-transporting NADH:ubiquinone oxidoreductase subunit NqrB